MSCPESDRAISARVRQTFARVGNRPQRIDVAGLPAIMKAGIAVRIAQAVADVP
jgi:hypothetical protein